MIGININDFKVTNGITLSNIPTDIPLTESKTERIKALKRVRKKIAKQQDIMYAHNRYGVLICLQGMDTSGKDSLIREVFKAFNPRGVIVHSFKTPTTKELKHDYLWRHFRALPEKGKFAVFNRTHYENVLVTRVNMQFLLNENIPGIEKVEDIPSDFWDKRFEQILHFEKHLVENGVIVLKFFLHLSKEEQRNRLIRRLVKEKHNWKFTPSDLAERALWDDYQKCYEEAINRTSKPYAPWYVIPADNKQTARYLVAEIIKAKMKEFSDIRAPELDPGIKENIEMYMEKLRIEKDS
jgi:PPK2 family polyphosphate:nucleotide phosphotransferase